MAKIGYIRISTINTKEQTSENERKRKIMKEFGVEKIFEEKVSEKDFDRPQLKAMLDYVREGDTLYIESDSGLAISVKDFFDIVDKLDKKGVNLVSKKTKMDSSTSHGRLFFTLLLGFAKFEREFDEECILERQREGIKKATLF